MSLRELEIAEDAGTKHGVGSADDKLKGNAAANKAVFDKLVTDVVRVSVNGLIEALTATSGAEEIGAEVEGVDGKNVAEILQSLKGQIDTALEKVVTNWEYEADNQALVLTLADGSKLRVFLSDFITENEFQNSNQIEFNVTGHKVKATIASGGVKDEMLDPALKNLLKTYADEAANAAEQAGRCARDASAFAEEAGDFSGMAENSAVEARESANNAANEAAIAYNYEQNAAAQRGLAEAAFHQARKAAQLAEKAIVHAPVIDTTTKNWKTWNQDAETYEDTGVRAQGADGEDGAPGAAGISPMVGVETIEGGHAVTIYDAAHPDGQSFTVQNGKKGEKGDPGETPGYDLLPAEQGSGSIVRTAVGADNVPVKAMEIAIQCVQPGSGDPSPYNVRPILGWNRIGIGSERASAADERYSKINMQHERPFAYLASDGAVTYHSSLVDAYRNGRVSDNSYGIIVLLHDYTIRAADEYMSVNHVIASPSKNIVLDLNGHTLTNPTNRNLFYLDADNYSLIITSTHDRGKYIHTNEAAPGAGTNKRCLAAIGNTGATAASAARSVSVSISNVDVEVMGGSMIASYYASPKISLSNGTFSTPTSTMISMQANKNWTASTIAKPEIALENITFNGSAFGWMNHFTNSSKTAAENSSLTLKLAGTNTINFTNAGYATEHGFQFRKGGAWISAFDPDNGFIQNAGNTIVSLNGAEPTGGGVYTVVMETPGPTMQIPLDRAVYGGTLNVLTGVLTITHKMTTLGDIDGWMFTNMGSYFFAQLAAAAKQSCDFSSSGYKPLPDGEVIEDFEYAVEISGEWVKINDPDYVEDDGEEIVGDVSGWLNERAGEYQLVYELAQPETVQLTPQEVRTVLGANTFAADTGEVTVTLRVDPTLALAELRAAILGSAE